MQTSSLTLSLVSSSYDPSSDPLKSAAQWSVGEAILLGCRCICFGLVRCTTVSCLEPRHDPVTYGGGAGYWIAGGPDDDYFLGTITVDACAERQRADLELRALIEYLEGRAAEVPKVHASNDVRDWKKSARERNSAPMDLWELNLRSGREKNVLSADGRNAEAEMAVARKKPLSPSVFSNCPGRSRVKRSPLSPTAARGDPCFRRLTGPRPKWTLTQLGEPQIWTLAGVLERALEPRCTISPPSSTVTATPPRRIPDSFGPAQCLRNIKPRTNVATVVGHKPSHKLAEPPCVADWNKTAHVARVVLEKQENKNRS
ncbi:hypothetical protein HPB51_011599 [Rhipicephalus microplus]|uniref:Uncharacterized protein n=1 Tax=Rhipicephalus microplus TaxID=6941 RepID=A0A9J6E8X8_RHIMP|nr:hypothetical protein HPB51_011599 [Rhipicephalus microplus]